MVVKLTLSPCTLEVVSWWEVCVLPSEALAVEETAVGQQDCRENTAGSRQPSVNIRSREWCLALQQLLLPLESGQWSLSWGGAVRCAGLPGSVRAFLSGCGEDWGLLAKGEIDFHKKKILFYLAHPWEQAWRSGIECMFQSAWVAITGYHRLSQPTFISCSSVGWKYDVWNQGASIVKF